MGLPLDGCGAAILEWSSPFPTATFSLMRFFFNGLGLTQVSARAFFESSGLSSSPPPFFPSPRGQ